MKKKVFVAFSGGVDSSVAALLLLEQGYDVTAVYMKNWSGESLGLDDNCPWEEDLEYVEKVADQLGIPYLTYNFEKEYREMVIENFYSEYKNGNTPNPDLLCNKHIKFDAFLNKALDEGADLIATGHYSITSEGRLYKGKDKNKDQTYFLAGLDKNQLEKSLFPIGDLEKKEVREIARANKLANSERKDSQGICFVGKVDVKEFISLRLKPNEGEIIDIDTNNIVGTHNGVWFFTQGQRKGLQIGGLDQPYYIVDKNVESNQLYVVKGKENPKLWQKTITVDQLHTIDNKDQFDDHNGLSAIIRYRGTPSQIKIEKNYAKKLSLKFRDPQWAPAPGHSVVFYRENECLGLAKIV